MAISAMVPNPRTGADKKYIARSYTPVTLPDTKGYVELVIKARAGVLGALLSRHFPGPAAGVSLCSSHVQCI